MVCRCCVAFGWWAVAVYDGLLKLPSARGESAGSLISRSFIVRTLRAVLSSSGMLWRGWERLIFHPILRSSLTSNTCSCPVQILCAAHAHEQSQSGVRRSRSRIGLTLGFKYRGRGCSARSTSERVLGLCPAFGSLVSSATTHVISQLRVSQVPSLPC